MFLIDFMFQFAGDEYKNLIFHFGISKSKHDRRRFMYHAFGEQEIAMLLSVLKSKQAIA